jgi:hypothetical protein
MARVRCPSPGSGVKALSNSQLVSGRSLLKQVPLLIADFLQGDAYAEDFVPSRLIPRGL